MHTIWYVCTIAHNLSTCTQVIYSLLIACLASVQKRRQAGEEEEDLLLQELYNRGGSGGVQPSGGFIQVEDPGRDDQLQANIAAFAFATRNTSNKLCANLQTREHMHVEHRKTCNYDSPTKVLWHKLHTIYIMLQRKQRCLNTLDQLLLAQL